MKIRIIILLCFLLLLAVFLAAATAENGPSGEEPAAKSIATAKALLRTGMNAGDVVTCRQARDLFLGALLKAGSADEAVLEYYVALADYRITAFDFRSGETTEAETMVREGQRYLDSAIVKNPAFGEAFALRGYLKGFEIALHPERAMGLGAAVFQDIGRAEELEPENPRVFLLKGSYLLYVPEAYGGGPDRALSPLLKAAELFDKETPAGPMMPDWGKDEAYLYLGLVYKRKNEPGRAGEMLRKALAVNPDYGWAKAELAEMGK